MDILPSVKGDTVTSTEMKPNVTPILQPFTSTEEKSPPFFDVSSNIYFCKCFSGIYNVIFQ